jgi:hypothetical protein
VHFFQYGNLNVGKSPAQNLTIIGEKKEGERVLNLLNKAHVASNFMGFVSPVKGADKAVFLGDLSELKKLINIYKIEEIIFCAADLTNTEIMAWMVRLGNKIEYKIVSENSNSIIGSSSKNTTGTLYTIDIQYDIATTMAKRNKRVLDFVGSLFLWIGSPVFFLFMKNKAGFFKNIGQVLLGKKTLVGYANGEDNQRILPKIKTGVLSPKDGVGEPKIDIETARRLDFFYAKDYAVKDDVEILFKAFRALGR